MKAAATAGVSILKGKTHRVPVKELNRRILMLHERLTDILSGSEEKFLHIGSSIQDFTVRARKLSEMTTRVSGLTSGEEISSAIKTLQKQLHAASQSLNSGHERPGGSLEKFNRTLQTATWLINVCDKFDELIRILRFISVFLQIEHARFGQKNAGFDTVSDNVKALANLIDAKIKNIIKDSRSLVNVVNDAVSQTAKLSDIQKVTTVKILKDAGESLDSLAEINEKSLEVTGQVASRSAEIYKSIAGMITSLQFQDITRQQIEHVQDILTQLHEKLDTVNEEAQPLDYSKKLEFVGWIRSICKIQSSQLLNTRKELDGAVCRIIGELSEISKNVKNIASGIQALSGDTRQSGDSLLSKVEAGIIAALQSLGANDSIEREIKDSFKNAVSGISGFVREVEEIGRQIKLISLNAQVKAACVGDEGKTFSILAEEIQRLSVDAKTTTTAILEKLASITAGPNDRYTGCETAQDNGKRETGGVSDNLNSLLSSITGINREFSGLLSQVIEEGQSLGSEIETLAGKIVFHKNMTSAIDDIAKEFTDMVDTMSALFPDATLYDPTVSLEALHIHYTTDGERKVHQMSATDVSPNTGGEVCLDVKTAVNEDLGGNVELF